MQNQTSQPKPAAPENPGPEGLDEATCSRLFLIRGAPGSGKTTYAKTLEIADHYEADMWFDQNGGYNPKKIKQAHEWCQRQAIAAMRSGRNVVVSNTFTRLWEMMPYKDAAQKLGVEVVEKVMTGDWPNVHGVPAEKVRQMRQRFEYASGVDQPNLRPENKARIANSDKK